MSTRTRAAILSLGIDPGPHRSHQVTAADVSTADLVVAMATEHVAYLRRLHPFGAARTATICFLAANLTAGARPLRDRVGSLSLEDAELQTQRDVEDPAGGDEPEYLACAKEIS